MDSDMNAAIPAPLDARRPGQSGNHLFRATTTPAVTRVPLSPE